MSATSSVMQLAERLTPWRQTHLMEEVERGRRGLTNFRGGGGGKKFDGGGSERERGKLGEEVLLFLGSCSDT